MKTFIHQETCTMPFKRPKMTLKLRQLCNKMKMMGIDLDDQPHYSSFHHQLLKGAITGKMQMAAVVWNLIVQEVATTAQTKSHYLGSNQWRCQGCRNSSSLCYSYRLGVNRVNATETLFSFARHFSIITTFKCYVRLLAQ